MSGKKRQFRSSHVAESRVSRWRNARQIIRVVRLKWWGRKKWFQQTDPVTKTFCFFRTAGRRHHNVDFVPLSSIKCFTSSSFIGGVSFFKSPLIRSGSLHFAMTRWQRITDMNSLPDTRNRHWKKRWSTFSYRIFYTYSVSCQIFNLTFTLSS